MRTCSLLVDKSILLLLLEKLSAFACNTLTILLIYCRVLQLIIFVMICCTSHSSYFLYFIPTSLSVQELASSLKIPFLETSAKSSNNVERAFLTMASEIHKRLASEGGGMQGDSTQARAQSAKINSAPLWLGGEKQTQETSNCC